MDFDAFQTKRELDALIEDVKKFNTFLRFFSLAIYTTFLVYSIITESGYFVLNIILLLLTLGYTAFAIVCTVRQAKGLTKSKIDKLIAKIYRYAKFSVMLLSAVLSIISILTAVESPTPISIILAILLPVCLVLQAIFEFFIVWITVRVTRFQIAISQDIEYVKGDILNIAMGFIKDVIFKRNKENPKKELCEEEEIIVVGSDSPLSVKQMKRVRDEKKKGNVFHRIFKKLFQNKTESAPSTLAEEEEIVENQ